MKQLLIKTLVPVFDIVGFPYLVIVDASAEISSSWIKQHANGLKYTISRYLCRFTVRTFLRP